MIQLAFLILLIFVGCASAPPPYVCVAGVATREGQSIQQVLICQPVPPGLIEAGP